MAIIDDEFPLLPSQTQKYKYPDGKKKLAKRRPTKSAGRSVTLNELPDELILEILNYVPGIDMQEFQLQTLLSLSLLTRNLHRIVSDKIYSTYDSHFCEPYLFLRTIISNPRLGESVRYAKFRYGEDAHLERRRYLPTARDKKVIKEGMKALDFPDWKGWATRCNSAGIELDILHTAVMLNTPNLTMLDVEDGLISAYSKAKWPELIKKAAIGEHFGHVHRFSALKVVCVDAQYMVIHHLAPILRLQSLRKLELRELSEFELDMRAPADLRRVVSQGCNNLEELVLKECSLRYDALETLICSARRLKSFRLYTDQQSVLFDDSGIMLQNALWRQKNSLEILDIDLEDDEHPLHNGGLEQFTVLKVLKCPLGMVADLNLGETATALESLPPALETICLIIRRGADVNIVLPGLVDLASEYPTLLPRLKCVQLIIQTPAEELDNDCERLAKAYSTTAVELIINLPTDSGDEEWEDWRTMSSDSDDSSEDSDEVELYSDSDDGSGSEEGAE